MNAFGNLSFSYCNARCTKICKNKSSKELGGAEILAEGNAEYRKACRNV